MNQINMCVKFSYSIKIEKKKTHCKLYFFAMDVLFCTEEQFVQN